MRRVTLQDALSSTAIDSRLWWVSGDVGAAAYRVPGHPASKAKRLLAAFPCAQAGGSVGCPALPPLRRLLRLRPQDTGKRGTGCEGAGRVLPLLGFARRHPRSHPAPQLLQKRLPCLLPAAAASGQDPKLLPAEWSHFPGQVRRRLHLRTSCSGQHALTLWLSLAAPALPHRYPLLLFSAACCSWTMGCCRCCASC